MKGGNVVKSWIAFLLTAALAFWNCSGNHGNETAIVYFGEEEPGFIPQLFAPQLFTRPDHFLHGFPSFSPDGKEVFWPVIPLNILTMKNENGTWSEPAVAPFTEGNMQAPSFSPDGGRLYFQLSSPAGHGDLDIWYVEKSGSGWSAKKNPGSPPNSEQMESQPSLTKKGTIYYTGFSQNAAWNRGIYKCVCDGNRYNTPTLLPEPVNTEYIDYTPFISPDETFLLFASTRPLTDENNMRIYVSFRHPDDTWTEPVNLNDIMDFDRPSRFPCMTPDGRFIVFLSENQYYWVSSRILEKCRP